MNPEVRPYLVSLYQNKSEVEQKLAVNGLAGEKFYMSKGLPEELKSVPSILVWDGEKKRADKLENYI